MKKVGELNSVNFRVPDFVGPDGTDYTDIEVIVSSEDGLAKAVKLSETLSAPLNRTSRRDLTPAVLGATCPVTRLTRSLTFSLGLKGQSYAFADSRYNRNMGRQVCFVLLVSALASGCGCSEQRLREATLKQDLNMMRQAIDKYTLDKDQAPQSLQDLVTEQYLKEIPKDPFTRRPDWVPQIGDVELSRELKVWGLYDVHSSSTKVGSDGRAYSTW